jgi:linearmycin/streptolysin S transport system permease protein
MITAVIRAGWLNLRRDRGALILSFVVPIVFFSIFAGIFGAQRSKTPRVTLAIADEDRSERSGQLIAALRAEKALKVVPQQFTAASAEAYVRKGDAPVALVIPKGFATWKMNFRGESGQPGFRLLADSADPIADQVVNGMLQKTIMTSMPEMMIDSGVDEVDKISGGLTPPQRASIQQNMDQYKAFRARPGNAARGGSGELVKISKTDVMGENKSNVVVALYAAGIGVMFLLFTASNAGGALLEENESGTLDRILTTRVSFTTLLVGKLGYLWTLGFMQLCVMFLWGALVFKLELFKHWDGFLLMAIPTTFCTSAFGLLLASFCRTRAQLGAISTLVVLTISALGGSMFPRFMMPEAVQKAGLVLFNSWALDGFTNVFWRDLPLTSLILPIAMLTGFGAAFFAAARMLVRRFEIA